MRDVLETANRILGQSPWAHEKFVPDDSQGKGMFHDTEQVWKRSGRPDRPDITKVEHHVELLPKGGKRPVIALSFQIGLLVPCSSSANISGWGTCQSRWLTTGFSITFAPTTSGGRCLPPMLWERRSGRRPTSPSSGCIPPRAQTSTSASPVSGSNPRAASTRTGCATTTPHWAGTFRPTRYLHRRQHHPLLSGAMVPVRIRPPPKLDARLRSHHARRHSLEQHLDNYLTVVADTLSECLETPLHDEGMTFHTYEPHEVDDLVAGL